MIKTLAVNCTPILACSKDDWKTPMETACAEMVMGAVRALCEFSLLVRQQNHCYLSLTVLDYVLKRFYRDKGGFQDMKMLKSAKT